MVNQQPPVSQDNSAEHIRLAQHVLKRPLTAILELFFGKEIRVIECINGDSKEKVLEVNLEKTTLSCLLGSNDHCEFSFLFMDDAEAIKPYIAHCNEEFWYDYIRKVWKSGGTIIEVKAGKDDCFLAFNP